MTTQNQNYRILEYMTKTTWLHFEDTLDYIDRQERPKPKIRLFAGRYQRGQGSQDQAYHFIDADDARVLFNDLAWGKKVKFTDYKGSNGQEVISRVLNVNSTDDGKVYFQLSSGPGRASNTGAVMPNGPATTKVNVGMTMTDARKIAWAVLEHMQAHATVKAWQRLMPAAAGDLPGAGTIPAHIRALSVADINNDLFGEDTDSPDPITPPDGSEWCAWCGEKPATPGQPCDHCARLGAEPTPAAPTLPQTDTQLKWANGTPVAVADMSLYKQFQGIMRGAVPFNREKAADLVYGR